MLLAIDTSTARIGMALHDGNDVLAEITYASGLHHTRELAPALARMLDGCGVKMEQIEAIGVATGPGSFTSLRVGVAFAKGLAAARHVPLIGIPTLDIVASSVPPLWNTLAAILQAGRGRLVVGWYLQEQGRWQQEGQLQVTNAQELSERIHQPVYICGELTESDRRILGRRYKNAILASPAHCVRRPAVLAEIAWQRWKAGNVDTAVSLAPIYVHVVGGPQA